MKFEVDGPPIAREGDQVEIAGDIRRGDIVWFDRVAPDKVVMRVTAGPVSGQCHRIDRGAESDTLRFVAIEAPGVAAPPQGHGMGIASRVIKVTQGNLDNSHIYLTDVMDNFPDDVIGGPDESHAAPRTVRIQWGNEIVETDIVRDKHIFRKRGWVARFFDAYRVQADDQVLLEQIDP